VVLTDLQGPAGFEPHWPVLWAVPEAFAAAKQPFGRRLVLRWLTQVVNLGHADTEGRHRRPSSRA